MPKYRFRWDAFDDDTVKELATAYGFDALATGGDPRGWLADIVENLQNWNIGPMNAPRSRDGYLRYVGSCRNGKSLRHLLCQAMIRFGAAGTSTDVDTNGVSVRKFAILIPGEQATDRRDAHPYQKEAWDRLNARLAEAQVTGVFQGLLVMPTGSGKTFTAVRWLVENILNRGGRVLWVAHRYELLEQAAEAFDRSIYLAEPKERRLRQRIVSGKHCAANEIGPDDDILICSVASLARRPDIVNQVLSDHFLVIDEAHHAPAKSYRDIIRRVNSQGPKRVLGLTATPTRTVESERPELARLFGNRPLYEVHARDLIDQQYLSTPVPIRVQTNAEVEGGITPEDLKHLKQFRDLTEEWKKRIATLASRNRLIVTHYLGNKKKYGKTLIFAINVLHANLLKNALEQQGVEVGCITSYHYVGTSDADAEAENHKEILERFRDGRSGLDVLVNVMILTEGVDVPGIQTVFLTRPTQSEILLRQMVGRALRGPKAGGTRLAYLVSFEDHWEQFRDLETPFKYLADICPSETPKPPGEAPVPKVIFDVAESEGLPYEVIQAAAEEFGRAGGNQPIDVFESLPHGWYILERPTETECEEGQDASRQRIHVHAHQKGCWDALIDYLYLEPSDDKALSKSSPKPEHKLRPSDLKGKVVKVITVIDGMGATLTPDENEIMLREHLGDSAKVIANGKESIKLRFENMDTCWAVIGEVSLDASAKVKQPKALPVLTLDDEDDTGTPEVDEVEETDEEAEEVPAESANRNKKERVEAKKKGAAEAARKLTRTAATSVLFSEYFGDCDVPKPSDHSVDVLLEHYRAGGERPMYHDMAERTRVDPYEVAQQVHMNGASKFTLIEESFKSSLVKAIFGSRRDYVAVIDQALYELQYPDEVATRLRPGIPIFQPRADQQLRPPTGRSRAHDLDGLMRAVREDGKALLNLPKLPFAGHLEWTSKIIKGWYGKAYWEKHSPHGTGTIRINCLLNSPDVSAHTMRFLLWHEYLHLYLQQLHTPKFRELEAKWPGRIEADRELDTLNERFGIAYW